MSLWAPFSSCLDEGSHLLLEPSCARKLVGGLLEASLDYQDSNPYTEL